MYEVYPTDPKRIRERIRRYERTLEQEQRRGVLGDGYGKRFLLGPLYMLMGDVQGALKSFDWYSQAFPDDGGEPYQYLTWALALWLGNEKIAALDKLYQTMLHNIYLVPHLLGENPRQLDIEHGSNWEELDYAMDLPQSLAALWDELALAWARSVRQDPRVVAQVDRYIEIHRELKNLSPGPRRSRLVKEVFAMRDHSFAFAD